MKAGADGKKMSHRKLLLIVLAVIAVSGAAAWLVHGREVPRGAAVEILQDGKVGRTLSPEEMKDDQTFTVSYQGHYNVIEVKDGRVRVREADCPNQICVHMGWLGDAGSIICLPHRLEIRYADSEDHGQGLDGVSR